VLNDPSQVSEFNGEVIEDGDFLITQPISDMYVRHNGQLYRKGITRTDANLYVAIDPISIPNYNTTNMNFEFDTELAERVINRYPEGVETRGLTTEEFDDRVEKAGVENLMHQRLQVVGEQAILTNEMKSSLKQAKTLVSEGVDPKIIEVETGWFIEDGKWKYFSRDILDQYKIKEDLDIVVNKEYQLKDIIDSSLLERLYPDIAKTKIIFYDNRETETIEEPDGLFTLGFYRGGSIFLNILESDIRPNVQIEGKSRKQELINALFSRDLGGRHDVHIDSIKRRLWGTTLLHEVQHLVQAKEGFSQGGSPNLFASITRTVYPEIANTNFKSASFNRTENINGIAQTIDSNFRLVDPQDKSEITCRT
ncbi:MAG: LPD23 domain-containing protein, partial [Candidatus Paceibacterota bacterium]